MSCTLFNPLLVVALSALLGGCGLTQSVVDGTASTANSVFYKQVKTLHLDLSSRAGANTAEVEMSALSVPTLVRVYQLRDNRTIERTDYERLLNKDDSALNSDLLDMHAVLVKPGEGAQLSIALHQDAKFVAVVALFRQPDTQANTWRMTLARDDLDPDQARVIDLGDNQMVLRPRSKQ